MAIVARQKDRSRNRSIPNTQAPPKRIQLVYLATKYRRTGVVGIVAVLWFMFIAASPAVSELSSLATNISADWFVHLQFASLLCAYLTVAKLVDNQLGATHRFKALLRFFRKDPESIKYLERCLLKDECPHLWQEEDARSSNEKPCSDRIPFCIKPLFEQ